MWGINEACLWLPFSPEFTFQAKIRTQGRPSKGVTIHNPQGKCGRPGAIWPLLCLHTFSQGEPLRRQEAHRQMISVGRGQPGTWTPPQAYTGKSASSVFGLTRT